MFLLYLQYACKAHNIILQSWHESFLNALIQIQCPFTQAMSVVVPKHESLAYTSVLLIFTVVSPKQPASAGKPQVDMQQHHGWPSSWNESAAGHQRIKPISPHKVSNICANSMEREKNDRCMDYITLCITDSL